VNIEPKGLKPLLQIEDHGNITFYHESKISGKVFEIPE
jgi:hypothetical protein